MICCYKFGSKFFHQSERRYENYSIKILEVVGASRPCISLPQLNLNRYIIGWNLSLLGFLLKCDIYDGEGQEFIIL